MVLFFSRLMGGQDAGRIHTMRNTVLSRPLAGLKNEKELVISTYIESYLR